jgi:hypothetical protein
MSSTTILLTELIGKYVKYIVLISFGECGAKYITCHE